MNYAYPIPGAQTDPNSFVADNTGQLGYVDQPLDGRTLVMVDYSQIVPSTPVVNCSLRIGPGGEPQLQIDSVVIGSTETSLSFFISGGIAGQQYTVVIVATMGDTDVRSDVLNVNVLGDGCGCGKQSVTPPFSDAYSSDGALYINTAPQFWVSATPPVSPKVLDRWYNTTDGVVSDYITNGAATAWVAANQGGGGGGGSTGNIIKMLPINPDGVSTTFTLIASDGTTVDISGTNYLWVSIDGVWQEGPNQYLVSGNQITFNQAPTPDAAIFMLWFAPTPSGGI
jgi:hypothetical protein